MMYACAQAGVCLIKKRERERGRVIERKVFAAGVPLTNARECGNGRVHRRGRMPVVTDIVETTFKVFCLNLTPSCPTAPPIVLYTVCKREETREKKPDTSRLTNKKKWPPR